MMPFSKPFQIMNMQTFKQYLLTGALMLLTSLVAFAQPKVLKQSESSTAASYVLQVGEDRFQIQLGKEEKRVWFTASKGKSILFGGFACGNELFSNYPEPFKGFQAVSAFILARIEWKPTGPDISRYISFDMNPECVQKCVQEYYASRSKKAVAVKATGRGAGSCVPPPEVRFAPLYQDPALFKLRLCLASCYYR